ncbi:hypothetical protein [Paenibacillus auburnensis]|uniref:hypothetical protein n=1 Tax=Paenibacillus auburnensis TaxID=2905649 RepID=UPI001F374406|nr:hypothetical protein [Paenibacillus auburnensis]
MDICHDRREIGRCPLSITRVARTFADSFHWDTLVPCHIAPLESFKNTFVSALSARQREIKGKNTFVSVHSACQREIKGKNTFVSVHSARQREIKGKNTFVSVHSTRQREIKGKNTFVANLSNFSTLPTLPIPPTNTKKDIRTG